MSTPDQFSPDVVTVAITRTDGGMTIKRIPVRVYEPVHDDAGNVVGRKVVHEVDPTPAFIEAELAKRPWMFKGATWEIVPNDYVEETTDRTYRNAWKHTKGRGKPDHDIPKAREIQRVYLRHARLAEFCRLDIEYAIVDEAGDQQAKKEIGAIRQKFRDVTEDPRIEAAQTIEELKVLRLDALIPETKGVNYMKEKMKVSPAVPGLAKEK